MRAWSPLSALGVVLLVSACAVSFDDYPVGNLDASAQDSSGGAAGAAGADASAGSAGTGGTGGTAGAGGTAGSGATGGSTSSGGNGGSAGKGGSAGSAGSGGSGGTGGSDAGTWCCPSTYCPGGTHQCHWGSCTSSNGECDQTLCHDYCTGCSDNKPDGGGSFTSGVCSSYFGVVMCVCK